MWLLFLINNDWDCDSNDCEIMIFWACRAAVIACWIAALIICWMFNLIRFTETELLFVILNEFRCKFSVEKSNLCITTCKLALFITQFDENCRLDIWNLNSTCC